MAAIKEAVPEILGSLALWDIPERKDAVADEGAILLGHGWYGAGRRLLSDTRLGN